MKSTEEKNITKKGTLYLVGTPIGNLSDLSPRAKKILSEVDFVAAEDTRVTGKLLSFFDISKPLISYYEQNKSIRANEILSRLKNDESCALVSDAGMPVISDPGEDIVRLCRDENIPVSCAPGPTAMATALAISGFPSGRFCFEGFLTVNKSGRSKHLESLVHEERTLIFYEAPHKLRRTLSDLMSFFGADRQIALCREMTKINEEVEITSIGKAIESYKEKDPRGEYVLIVRGESEKEIEEYSIKKALDMVNYETESGSSQMDAVKAVAKHFKVSKSKVYKDLMESREK